MLFWETFVRTTVGLLGTREPSEFSLEYHRRQIIMGVFVGVGSQSIFMVWKLPVLGFHVEPSWAKFKIKDQYIILE